MRAAGLFVLALLCLCGPELAAQDKPRPAEVQVRWPQDQPRPKGGKIAIYEGEADAIGVKFAIPAGSVFSPSAVVLKVTDGSGPLKLGLRNDLSDQWDRLATTDAAGMAEIKFRTEGSAMLLVQSPQPNVRTKFQVAFFQGVELPVHKRVRPPFLSPKDAAAKAAGTTPAATPVTTAPAPTTGDTGQPIVLWVIAGLLGVIALIGGAMLMRRNK